HGGVSLRSRGKCGCACLIAAAVTNARRRWPAAIVVAAALLAGIGIGYLIPHSSRPAAHSCADTDSRRRGYGPGEWLARPEGIARRRHHLPGQWHLRRRGRLLRHCRKVPPWSSLMMPAAL